MDGDQLGVQFLAREIQKKKGKKQAELQITAAEDRATAAELRAQLAEARAREAVEALARVEEALRERFCTVPSVNSKLRAAA